MSAIDVLMPVPLVPFVINEVEKRYKLHKLWLAENPKALIAEVGDKVRFLVTTPNFRGIAEPVKIDGPFMSQFPNLKAVVNFGVGYDIIDAVWAGAHGIMVTHTPNVLNEEVADFALGLTLSVVRQIPQADSFVRSGRWEREMFSLSSSMIGRTMGILGLGRIGKAIAKRAEAFGVKIIYHGRHKQNDVAYPYFETLIDMAHAADILMVVTPGTAETKHMVNREVLEALGPEGILVNVARGSVIDEPALIEALESHKILSAALDVYANEPHVSPRLIALPQLVLVPHLGSSSEKTIRAISQLVIDNLDALAEGKPPITPTPETPLVHS